MQIQDQTAMNHKKYKRNQETISGRLHDQMVMMDVDKGEYFALNPIATRIWDLLEQPRTSEEICNLLLQEFEVDASRCKLEVQNHLGEMLALQLIFVM